MRHYLYRYMYYIGEMHYLIPQNIPAIFWKGFVMSKQSGKNVWEFVMVDRKGCLLVCYDICAAGVMHRKIPHLWIDGGLSDY